MTAILVGLLVISVLSFALLRVLTGEGPSVWQVVICANVFFMLLAAAGALIFTMYSLNFGLAVCFMCTLAAISQFAMFFFYELKA